MRPYDDDAYRLSARQKIDPDKDAHTLEEAPAAPAPKVHTAQMVKADTPRKVYLASSAASLKKKAAEDGKPQVVPDETWQEKVGHDQNDKGTSNNKKNPWIAVIVLLVIVVAVVIIVVVIVTGGGDDDGPLSEEEIINLVQSHSPSTTFDNPSSPQRLTLDWITQDKNTQKITNKDRILQRFAIATLYYATGYSPYAQVEPNECNWSGMGCHQSNVVVDWINLHNTNLDGSLPGELGLLTGLTCFDFAKNFALEGRIPSEISKLTDMNEFFISDTELTGSIPSNLCPLERSIIDCDKVVCNCCQCK